MNIKPMIFSKNHIYHVIGKSKPISNEELIARIEKEEYYNILTRHGGRFGSDVNIFVFKDDDMVHSEDLNSNYLVVYYNIDEKQYETNVVSKNIEEGRKK